MDAFWGLVEDEYNTWRDQQRQNEYVNENVNKLLKYYTWSYVSVCGIGVITQHKKAYYSN